MIYQFNSGFTHWKCWIFPSFFGTVYRVDQAGYAKTPVGVVFHRVHQVHQVTLNPHCRSSVSFCGFKDSSLAVKIKT